MTSLAAILLGNPYPGRGIVLAGLADDTVAIAYLLTGRTEMSRSRELDVGSDGTITVRAVGDGSHDDLRHYVAAVHSGDWSVIGNGSHVPVITNDLVQGKPFGDALANHQFEPDPPIHTPRIVLAHRAGEPVARFGSALHARNSDSPYWVTSEVRLPLAGAGYLLTTYASGPAPTSQQSVQDGILQASNTGEFADILWSALDPALRVAIAVRPLADHRTWVTRS